MHGWNDQKHFICSFYAENASCFLPDVNDNDPSFDQDNYLFSVSELSSVGYIVGTVHATDLDIGGAGWSFRTIVC